MDELNERLESRLIECLDSMDGGADLASCLARYPEDASWLRPYLELHLSLRLAPLPEPSAAAYDAGRTRLLERLHALSETTVAHSAGTRWAMPLVAAFGTRWGMLRAQLAGFFSGGWARADSPLARVAAVAALIFVLGGGALGASAAAGFQPARDVLAALPVVQHLTPDDDGQQANAGKDGEDGKNAEAPPDGDGNTSDDGEKDKPKNDKKKNDDKKNEDDNDDASDDETDKPDDGTNENTDVDKPSDGEQDHEGDKPSDDGEDKPDDPPASLPDRVCVPEDALKLLADLPQSAVKWVGDGKVCILKAKLELACIRVRAAQERPDLREKLPSWVRLCSQPATPEPTKEPDPLPEVCVPFEVLPGDVLSDLFVNVPGHGRCIPDEVLKKLIDGEKCIPKEVWDKYPKLDDYLPDDVKVCADGQGAPEEPTKTPEPPSD